MREFQSLETDGYVFFGKTKLDLDYKGVTVIQAQNLDARRGTSSTNGAGKSLLVGLLPEIFFDSVPSGKEVKAQSMSRAGAITLKYKGNVYRLERQWGKKKAFNIFKNGKDTEVRTLAIAGERAKQLIGLTEEEFYSTAFIDVNRPHPLIRGSSAQRQEYFTSMFRLHDTDALRKLLLQELRDCEKAADTYKELVQQFQNVKGESGAVALKDLKAKRDKLLVKVERFKVVSSKVSDVQALLDFRAVHKKLIAQVNEICDPDDVEAQLSATKKVLKSLRCELEVALAYEAEQAQIEKAAARVRKIKAELEAEGLNVAPEKAEKGARLLGATEAEVERLHSDLRKAKADLSKAQVGLEELGKDARVTSAFGLPNDDRKKACEAQEKDLEHELDHVRQFKTGKCPTCGHKVEARDIGEIKEELKKVRTKLATWNIIGQLEESRLLIKALNTQLQELESKLEKYTRWAKAHKLLSSVPEIPKWTIAAPEHTEKNLRRRIEKAEHKVSVLERAEPLVDSLRKLMSLTPSVLETHEELKVELKALSEASNRLIALESKIESEAEKIKALKQMRDKALTLKDKSADIPVLKALLEVYSNKGLKKLMIQRYASVIQDQLNKFRSILFSEDFTFEIIYDTKLHILVHRRYGKIVKSSDVRKLSGAEGRAFTLLLLLATLTLIPRSRRLNFLILDEADSNMGPDMFQNFLRFIPVLNKVIPHIVIVTPKKDVQYEGARVFTVVKSKGKSRLIAGRPNAP